MKQAVFIKTVFLLISILTGTILYAQDPGDGPDAVSIDGGLALLVAGGIAYGINKVKNKRK